MTTTSDGRLLTMAWVHDVIRDVTLTARAGFSDDGGRTWSEPFDTGILGGPLNPIRLADGRILAAYARRTAPRGIRACLSDDGGRTWAVEDEIVLWDEARRAATGTRASSRDVPDADLPLWGTMWGWTFGGPVPRPVARRPRGRHLLRDRGRRRHRDPVRHARGVAGDRTDRRP